MDEEEAALFRAMIADLRAAMEKYSSLGIGTLIAAVEIVTPEGQPRLQTLHSGASGQTGWAELGAAHLLLKDIEDSLRECTCGDCT